MKKRTERLKRLVMLQERLKALHETKHARHLADAAAAGREATELMQAFEAAGQTSELFPELYHRRIGFASAREQQKLSEANREAGRVAQAKLRTNIAARAYREALRFDERLEGEKEQLERIERTPPKAK